MTLRRKTAILSALAVVALATACSSTPPAKPMSSAPAQTPPTQTGSQPMEKASPIAAAPAALPAYLDPKNPISTERSVYFEFDDASIKKQYFPLIEMHGRYLASQPTLAIKIEGNADERGSAEYNLALGQRRAEAVATALKVFGVKDGQMERISWGKERPKVLGHDESAWAQNRRADLTYPSK